MVGTSSAARMEHNQIHSNARLTSSNPEGAVAEGTTRASVVPTARMQACEENRRRVRQPKREAWPLHRKECCRLPPCSRRALEHAAPQPAQQQHQRLAHLWRVDDGRKLLHAVHSQVGDGEGSACELLRPQLALLGLWADLVQTGHADVDSSAHNETACSLPSLTGGVHCKRALPQRANRQGRLEPQPHPHNTHPLLT